MRAGKNNECENTFNLFTRQKLRRVPLLLCWTILLGHKHNMSLIRLLTFTWRPDTNEFSRSCKSKVFFWMPGCFRSFRTAWFWPNRKIPAFEIMKKKNRWHKSKPNGDFLAQMFPGLWPWCEHTVGGTHLTWGFPKPYKPQEKNQEKKTFACCCIVFVLSAVCFSRACKSAFWLSRPNSFWWTAHRNI